VTPTEPSAPGQRDAGPPAADSAEPEEHFKPTGTLFILAMFVAALILLWASVYVILISRGVTV
jgi:hypothetical protein